MGPGHDPYAQLAMLFLYFLTTIVLGANFRYHLSGIFTPKNLQNYVYGLNVMISSTSFTFEWTVKSKKKYEV